MSPTWKSSVILTHRANVKPSIENELPLLQSPPTLTKLENTLSPRTESDDPRLVGPAISISEHAVIGFSEIMPPWKQAIRATFAD